MNKFVFFLVLIFLTLSCSKKDKEHTVEKYSRWTQTIGDTTPIWLEGHIDEDIMFLSNDLLTFELQEIKARS